jgi:hypothetical protein
MGKEDALAPCAADMLIGVRQVEIGGKKVGIAGLDASITEVEALGLHDDAAISAALMKRITAQNYVPEALSGAYAKAVVAEYYAVRMKNRMEKALKNFERMNKEQV